jgi:hypothetical protein
VLGKQKQCQIIKFTAAIKWKPCKRRGFLGLGEGGSDDEDFWTEGVQSKTIEMERVGKECMY